MSVKANRVCRIFLAVMMLFLSVAAVPGRAAADPWVPIGKVENGVWRLDPSNYTYRALQKTKELNLSGKGIRAIEGIEHLAWLTSLDLSYNELENLDLSLCTKLTELKCEGNRLTSLDISPCGRLKVLDCSDNALGELNVAPAGNLQKLDCRNCGLKTLDVSANRSLTELYCSGNEIPEISVTHLKSLKILDVAGTGISSLDVSKNGGLTTLDCSSNPGLKELDLKANIRVRELFTDGTGIMNLDLSKQRGLADTFCSRNGYGYELTEDARIWRLEEGMLTANPGATIQVGAGITIQPAGDDPASLGIALPGYLQYKPADFTKVILASDYDEMCHYFSMKVGPAGSIFGKADEGWFYENAHTVVRSAGLAVQARQYNTDKAKSSARAFTVYDENGNFKFRCTIEYIVSEDAIEFAKRLNQDHTEASDDVDLWGYYGKVQFYACGNAVVIMEGIPSAANDRTPTLESYIASNPETPLYLID